jgi:predicted dehydrogenase
MEALKVGLIGLGRGGRRVAEALLNSAWCELVAVGSPKSKRLDRFTEEQPGIATYDDFRSLIVEQKLDALFLAIPPFLRKNVLKAAADRGLPVWMLTPPGRDLEETLQIGKMFQRVGCPLVVSRAWGTEPTLQADAIQVDQVGQLFLARGKVMDCWDEDLGWRGDSHRAGGGVLLDQGYPIVDTIIQAMGMPSSVYAVAGGRSRPGTRFPYDTEDTAAVVCHYTGGGIAEVTACWTSGPSCWEIELYGMGGSLRIDGQQVVNRDRAGGQIRVQQKRQDNILTAQVEEFLSQLGGSQKKMLTNVRQHLPTMAVIEAAYLSARTGQPESPSTIFNMHDIKEEFAGD